MNKLPTHREALILELLSDGPQPARAIIANVEKCTHQDFVKLRKLGWVSASGATRDRLYELTELGRNRLEAVKTFYRELIG